MALPPDESLASKDGTVLICVLQYIVLKAHVYMNISHLLGEHLCIVKNVWVP